jgi:hypothetical protein
MATLRSASGTKELRIPEATDLVKMQLFDFAGSEDSGRYHIAVRSLKNETIWEQDDLAPKQVDLGDGLMESALVFEIPAERLPSGDYKVFVTGTETLEKDFTVVREGR